MKRVLKGIGIVLVVLVGLFLLVGGALTGIGHYHLNKTYDFPPSNIVLPTDKDSLAYGKHRVETLCVGCHGPDLGGIVNWFNAAPLGVIDSANLTSGEGGIGREFASTEDYVRAIRHGINRDGKPIFMPAVYSTSFLSNEDLGAIIAYLQTIPPVDRTTQGARFTPLAKILLVVGVLDPLPVEKVSHQTQVSAPPPGATSEYGMYLVNTNDCRVCHGENLAGDKYPDPTIPIVTPNLTPGGEVGAWSEAEFIQALRTGIKPSGHTLNPEHMPWKTYRLFTDDELKAIYLYLQSLPKRAQFAP